MQTTVSMKVLALAATLAGATGAAAAPGVGDPVYGATVTPGTAEVEARYGRLTGGSANGNDGLILEGEYGVSKRLSLAVLVETGRGAGRARQANAVAIEAVRTLGRIEALKLDTAIYVEFKHVLNGDPDAVEVKGLFEHAAARFDARLNLIAEKPFRAEPVEFGYAASIDWAVIGDEFKLGAAAFGDLGTSARFGGRQEHFIGPQAKFEIEHIGPGEIEIEAGWLAAVGKARDMATGQARLLVSYEAHF
jgi:hypothetical protein